MLTKAQKQDLINRVTAWVPEWGREYVEAAFAGDSDAALSLVVSCHDHQRAVLAHAMYAARVEPRAFREVLSQALTQTHHYAAVLRQARTWPQFVRWCRYAAFEMPSDVPDPVAIYRGVCNASAEDVAKGASWTLSRERAEWFSQRWLEMLGLDASAAVVISATVPRASLLFYSDERQEQEVIPDTLPPPGWCRL